MWTRTKIICTMGPAVNSPEKIRELIRAGMSVARLNFSHGTHEEHLETMKRIKEARKELGVPVAIMLDTKGPEVRLGKLAEEEFLLAPGHQWLLVPDEVEGTQEQVTIRPGSVLKQFEKGTTVLIDDGYISAKVLEKSAKGALIEIVRGGVVKSGRGINVPDVELGLPALTDKDVADIEFGCKHDVDMIAASFIRSKEHITSIRELLKGFKKDKTLIFAKIENSEGVRNFDEIVLEADGIMIARGDLGVELPLSRVPMLQKMMIRKCADVGKPAITATQMLESMIYHPRPTRAETSDVANAIYDSTAAVMLSGETAVGHYPIETVDVMRSVIEDTESDFDYENFFRFHTSASYNDIPLAVTLATVKTAYATKAKAIFAYTTSGKTARLLARYRAHMPIVAMTYDPKCYHQLAAYWGIIPFLAGEVKDIEEAFEVTSRFAIEQGIVSKGDLAVVTSGTPFGVAGTTNMMVVEKIK